MFASTFLPLSVLAESNTTPPETWKCSSCPDPSKEQQVSTINLGIGWLSNDSFAFGQSSGVTEKGAYGLLDGEYRYQKNADRIEIYANDLGLDQRSYSISVQTQGKYRLDINGQNIPSYKSDTTYTPYYGVDDLAPGSGWVGGNTSADFPNLSDQLMQTNWYSNRKKVSLDFRYIWNPSLESDINVTRSSNRGNQPLGLMLGSSFFGRSVIALAPQNYETKSMSLTLQRKKPTYQWSARYELSQFFNDHSSLRWENLFDTPAVDHGQAGLAPDNQFHQLSWQATYTAIENWIYSAALSYGLSTQNEDFLPDTINPSLSGDISADSLDGKIAVGSILLNALYRQSPKQSYDFRYHRSEQDNQTKRVTSLYVIADSALASKERSSRPYGFRNQSLSAKSHTKLNYNQRLTVFADYRIYDRDYQSLSKGKEGRAWVQLQHKIKNSWDYAVKMEHSKRTGSDYNTDVGMDRDENPLLRKYNLADRKQNQIVLSGTNQLSEKWATNVAVSSARDAYEAELGLEKAGQTAYNVDLHYMHSAALHVNFYVNLQEITATQKGATTLDKWTGEHEDTVYTQGLNVSYEWRKDKLYLDFDAVHSRSVGRIDIDGKSYPDLTISRMNYKLGLKYTIRDNLNAEGFFEYENYEETDWSLDGMSANSVENVLGLGEVPPDYEIGHVGLSLAYTF